MVQYSHMNTPLRPQAAKIAQDLEKKMVFLTGPRQVGKTTLAQSLKSQWSCIDYLNYDSDNDRSLIVKQQWDRKADLIILDEIHKMKKWKSGLKGIYDTEGVRPRILVTGSARMDVYRRGGDSLAGRYFLHHLLPFSVRELRGHASPKKIFEDLMTFGGFPEPFFLQSEEAAQRWRKTHLERIVREDVQDLEPVKDIRTLLLLVDMLRERVGSTISFGSLANDLHVSYHTVKRWVQILENMYVLFVVPPYHRNLARAILKEPKIYFYDTGAVRNGKAARLENTVALCLKKDLLYREDTQGLETQLHYVRDKEKREVDFLTLVEGKMELLVEVKLAETDLSRSLAYYHRRLKPIESLQIVHETTRRKTVEGISVLPAAEWLDTLAL